tara:strand:- start:194 stop:934 length:741 start_codon:yes stop_codon:yes gene_type:complete
MDIKRAKHLFYKYYYGNTIYENTNMYINKKNKIIVNYNLTKLLKDMSIFFNNHNIRYFISNHTLLGAYRNSSLIEYNDNLVLRIHQDDWNKYRIHLNKSKYIIQNYYIIEKDYWDKIICKIETPFDSLHINIISSEISYKDNTWKLESCTDVFDLPTNKILINDLYVEGPNKSLIEKNLRDTYGDNFMTPRSQTYSYRNVILGINLAIIFSILILILIIYKFNLFIFIPTLFTLSVLTIVSFQNNF